MPTSPAICADCGHDPDVHAHCRPGTDCGLCECARFRRPLRSVLRDVQRMVHLR